MVKTYFSDTAEISSNAFETVDTDSTTENEYDINCIEIQPLVSIDPTDHDIRFLVKLSQILQQSSVIESFHPAPSSMSNKAQVRLPSGIPIVSQPSKCLKFMTFREGCFVISN